ncbi:hypothetical protein V8F33_004748 [Rhypophila sp. PSN 637]
MSVSQLQPEAGGFGAAAAPPSRSFYEITCTSGKTQDDAAHVGGWGRNFINIQVFPRFAALKSPSSWHCQTLRFRERGRAIATMAPVIDPFIEKLGFLFNITVDQIHGEYVVKINDVTQKKVPVAIFPAPPKEPFEEWWLVLLVGAFLVVSSLLIGTAFECATKRRRIANTVPATMAENDAEAAGPDSDSCESNNKSMGGQGDKGHDGSPDLHTQDQLTRL